MNNWKPVAQALLGSWPSQVAAWGRDGIAAYTAELEARGLTAESALVAIRSCPAGQNFPPSAPELAGLARRDPDRPTFGELMAQLYGPGGVFGVKRSGVTVSDWVLKFVAQPGNRERLRLLEVDCPDGGKWRRRELEQAWTTFLEVNEGRAVAEIATRSARSSLGRFDPAAALSQRSGA